MVTYKRHLFTMVVEYEKGTYISQVTAASADEALYVWISEGTNRFAGCLSNKLWKEATTVITLEDDSPVPVSGQHNVWCTSLRIRKKFALINIVKTAKV